MSQARKRVLGTVGVLWLAICAGCSGKPSVSTSTGEVTVTGVVTIRGQPARSGEVSFDPSNYRRPDTARTAPIGPDGRYTIKTLVGLNTVRVTAPELSDSPSAPTRRGSGDEDEPPPERQSVPGYGELTFDAPGGESTFDIKLPTPKQ